jgi:hypothetical protein
MPPVGLIQSGDTVFLRSNAWGKYCAVEDIDKNVVHCNRNCSTYPLRQSTCVRLMGSGDGLLHLRSQSCSTPISDKFVTAGGPKAYFRRTRIRSPSDHTGVHH